MKQGKAIIIRGTGRKSKEFRATLDAKNGKTLAPLEHYKRKATLLKILKDYFPNFVIHDTTLPKK